jgi:hypothetical protein
MAVLVAVALVHFSVAEVEAVEDREMACLDPAEEETDL